MVPDYDPFSEIKVPSGSGERDSDPKHCFFIDSILVTTLNCCKISTELQFKLPNYTEYFAGGLVAETIQNPNGYLRILVKSSREILSLYTSDSRCLYR